MGSKLGLLAASALLVGFVHARMPVPTRAEQGELFVPRPEVARATSIGFRSALADYYWMRAVQIVGAAARPQDHGPLLGRLIDVVTTLDPWVDHPYRFAAVWLTEGEDTVRTANRLLERGVAHHPDDWRMYFYLGFNHFYYLHDHEAAADALEGAVALPDTPLYLRRLVARLRAGSDGLDTAAAFLQQLARNAPDEFARAEYEKALDEVETERRARVIDAALRVYRERTGRDVQDVAELTQGEDAVLVAIPPEPHGWEWVIDAEDGRVVSSWYGHRYEPQREPSPAEVREAKARERERIEAEAKEAESREDRR